MVYFVGVCFFLIPDDSAEEFAYVYSLVLFNINFGCGEDSELRVS